MSKQKYNIPANWSTKQRPDGSYYHEIPIETINNWKNERRKKDNIDSFIDENGFHLVGKGQREGTIYFVENFKMCEVGFEISGDEKYDILITVSTLRDWFLPEEVALTISEKAKIVKRLKSWLNGQQLNALVC